MSKLLIAELTDDEEEIFQQIVDYLSNKKLNLKVWDEYRKSRYTIALSERLSNKTG